MKNVKLMAVDLGTSLIKVGIYDLAGRCLAQAKESVQSERPAPDQFIQRGTDIYASVLRCIRNAAEKLQDASDVAAIAFTGQMAGFMGVGEDWSDVTGWSCSIDTRYTPFAQRQMTEHSEEFLNISGTNSPLFSSKYAWFSNVFPEKARSIRKYMMLNGYILGRLGDMPLEDAVIDGSLLTWTGLADVKNRQWSDIICGALDVDKARLPRIVGSSQVVARLSGKAARAIGLTEGIPLVAGAGDKIAGCVGAGCLAPGEMLFEAASFGAVSCRVEDFRPDREARHFDILNGAESGDLYAHYYMPGSGITQEWYVNQFIRQERESLSDAYRRADEAVSGIGPGSDGLFAIGMLGGTVMPFNGDLRGVFLGHSWTHTPAHFYRALIESFALSLATAIDRIDAMYAGYQGRDSIRVIGGGIHSPNCLQIYADVLGIPLVTLGRDDSALWGACVLAAKGIGLVDDVPAFVEARLVPGRRFDPDMKYHEKYLALWEQYNRYETALSDLCRDRLR